MSGLQQTDKKGNAKKPAEIKRKKDKKVKTKRRLPPSRQKRIVIPEPYMEKSSYADMVKKTMEGFDTDALGRGIKHTRSGATSMVVEKGEEGALADEKLKVAIEAVLDADAVIRLHTNLLQLEVQGISIDDNKKTYRRTY